MSALPKPDSVPPISPRAKRLQAAQGSRSLRPETIAALLAFDRARPSEKSRAAYALGMALLSEVREGTGALPEDLARLVLHWDDDQYAGTTMDLELAGYAVAELLASE
jgi:hypothetical protein